MKQKYKQNSKQLINFKDGITSPDGKIYYFLCQCARPDRYILTNDANFNCSKWSAGTVSTPSNAFVNKGVFGTKMNIMDGGLSFEISPETSMVEDIRPETATNLLEGQGITDGTLNKVERQQSLKYYQMPVNKNGI